MTAIDEATALQIQKILDSDTMRASEALRRLFRYLADKTIAGEADDLKEYTVAIDGLGKPPAYDPRHESAVRIQIGRLRQKLVEYYHAEGKDDPIVIELPKGRFRLSIEARSATRGTPGGEVALEHDGILFKGRPAARMPLMVVLLLTVAWATVATVELLRQDRETSLFRASWSPEVEALWRPFLSTDRPALIAIANPPFADITGFGTYGDRSAYTWDELMETPGAAKIRRLQGNSDFQPYLFFTGTAEATASFQLGKLLGGRIPHLSVVRNSDVSWSQFADSNVIFVGGSRLFDDRLRSAPVELEFLEKSGGIEILHPRAGDPSIPNLGSGKVRGTGRKYALVSTTPGPDGKGVVRAFTSIGTSARLAALQAFSDPAEARALFRNLAGPDGKLPAFFQVIILVTYTDGVPTNTEYVFHRELRLKTSTH